MSVTVKDNHSLTGVQLSQRLTGPHSGINALIQMSELRESIHNLLSLTLMRWFFKTLLIILLVFVAPVGCKVAQHFGGIDDDAWWQLRRDSSGQAPDPNTESQAVIQVYAARAARWRGAFGVHSWIVVKPSGASRYTRLEVIGYALRWSDKTVRISQGRPDGWWYGNRPWLLRDLRGGEDVDAVIERLLDAAISYPQNDQYSVWPGPNSNTFIAELARIAPELQLELPVTAIGKDYLPNNRVVAAAPSGTGIQLSAGGLFGVMLALDEGIEINLAGLSAGIDLWPPAIKLPGVGRLGFEDQKRMQRPATARSHQTHLNHQSENTGQVKATQHRAPDPPNT